MPTIKDSDAAKHACPFNNFNHCLGALCMAWQWVGPTTERTETNNLVPTDDGPRPGDVLPPTPAGEGWTQNGEPYLSGYENSAKLKLPKMTVQRWVKHMQRTLGQCGRVQGIFDDIPF